MKTIVELVADRTTRRLVGGSVIGEDGAAGSINVIATALRPACASMSSSSWIWPIRRRSHRSGTRLLIAAQQLMKALAG